MKWKMKLKMTIKLIATILSMRLRVMSMKTLILMKVILMTLMKLRMI